jgi:hypothetical protein
MPGLPFDESDRTLFCSDLPLQIGDLPALTHGSVIELVKADMTRGEAGPFAHATAHRGATGRALESLAELAPRTLAMMHGSSNAGDGAQALRDLARITRQVLGPTA